MDEELKKRLISVLELGEHSPLLNDFIGDCAGFCMQYLLLKVNYYTRQRIYQENGIECFEEKECLRKLALDCIADLFEVRNNKFYQLHDFFNYGNFDVRNAEELQIISKIRTLIWCAAHNRIYELNDIEYYRLRNALNLCLKRYPEFKKVIYNNKDYIYTCDEKEINFQLLQIDKDLLTEKLLEKNLHDAGNPELMQVVFNLVNLQKEYNKAIYYNTLVQSIYDYHMRQPIEQIDTTEELRDEVSYQEEFTENLRKTIRKSPKFKYYIYNALRYVYSCDKKELDFMKEQYPVLQIIMVLNQARLKDIKILFVLEEVYSIVNRNILFNKALLFTNLQKILLDFYRKYL